MDIVAVKNGRGGFTLVELMISMLLFGIVMTAVYSLLNTNVKSYSSQENLVTRNQDLRAAMDLMVREIRMAGCDPTGAGSIGFKDDSHDSGNGTDSDSLYFSLDVTDTAGTGDPDGKTDGPNEDINYYLYTSDGIQKIGRRTGGASATPQPVAEYVTDLAFTFYDDSGTELSVPLSATDLKKIYAIQISITAETPKTDPILLTKRSKTLTTRVRVRNTGLE